jgi:hypothetical protein
MVLGEGQGDGTVPQAGISEVALFVFQPRQVTQVLEKMGYHVRGSQIFHGSGESARFSCCQKQATAERLGRVMPGSYELLCDDPLCLDRYAAALVSE